jgi:hypothetical protein
MTDKKGKDTQIKKPKIKTIQARTKVANPKRSVEILMTKPLILIRIFTSKFEKKEGFLTVSSLSSFLQGLKRVFKRISIEKKLNINHKRLSVTRFISFIAVV